LSLFSFSSVEAIHATTTTTDRQPDRQMIALSRHRLPHAAPAAAFNRRTDNCNIVSFYKRAAFARQTDRQTVALSGKQIANCKITAQHHSTDRQTDGQLQYHSICKTDMLYDHCMFFFVDGAIGGGGVVALRRRRRLL